VLHFGNVATIGWAETMVKEGSEDSGKFKVSVKKKRKVAIF
jgi:hypothetical protein